ncbi:MAG: HlyD family efflux transporter periplasmic adaptor subunit [Treponema sp.]|nr:HlyD family efflux transporter periplasmic adaptor subunit [Treponema sp.]
MKGKFRLAVVLLLLLVVIGASLFFARTFLGSSKANNVTYTVREETYENAIDISGTVQAAQSQTLQALSDGTVIAVYVKQGDEVKKGDVILQLDDTTQRYNLEKHLLNMQVTRINGSAKEYELMKTEKASLEQKINERKVTATFDGIIAAISASVGDSLAAKDSIGTLVDKSYLTAQVEIAETDVASLAVGQKVTFSFPAYKKDKVEGYVVSWPAIGETTSRGATVVKARLRIDEYPPVILPNFSFSGTIEIAPPETFLLVSSYAVGRENGAAFVVKSGSAEKIPVNVQNYGAGYVKILSGNVKAGDVLVAQSSGPRSGTNPMRGGMPSGMGGMPGGGMGVPGSGSGSRNGSGGGSGMPRR